MNQVWFPAFPLDQAASCRGWRAGKGSCRDLGRGRKDGGETEDLKRTELGRRRVDPPPRGC